MSAAIKIHTCIGPSGFAVVDLEAELERHPGARLDVFSDGGDSRSAGALAKRIESAGLNVHCHQAASAAVLIVIAGNHRILASNGWLGTHPCWTAISGGRAEFEAAARYCAAVDDLIAAALARWSKMTKEAAAKAVADGKVWTPAEALDTGMVDEIGPASELVDAAPERLEDGPARAVEVMRAHAESARHRAAAQRAKAEKGVSDTIDGSFSAAGRAAWQMCMSEFRSPPERTAAIFDASATHKRRGGALWTPRWPCAQCGALNFSPPADRNGPARCFICHHQEE